ncbi:MAG: hypothetical protein A2X11_02615 [Bacteroidetes bacterium GWE2_42_24]|nr:MAG: hypothetical protein A2X11_02615 [Bacteroidetes bacterium GWE2_42_24]
MNNIDLKTISFDDLLKQYEQVVAEFDLYRRTMEQRLMMQRDLTERHAQTKTAIIAKITHSIKIPMNGVLGMIDILKQSSLNNEQSDYLHIIQTYSTQLLGMINDLTDFTKIESGDVQIINSPCKISENVEEVVKSFQLRTKGKGIELVFIPENLPETIVCDGHRLNQVLTNLLGNCIQATKTGTISIKVHIGKSGKSNPLLSFDIYDTSVGLSESESSHLRHAIDTSDYMSLLKLEVWGISMAISYQLTKLMNGDFGFEVNPGQGNHFWFTFPIGINQNSANKSLNLMMTTTKEKRPLKILLVEDNLLNQKFAVATLVREGHSVDIAENGKIAIERFKNSKYDLILMDIQMPVMDGIQATLKIREIEQELKSPHHKIIAVTAYALEKDRTRCLAAGMDDFIAKPFKPQELVKLIDNLEL